LDADSFGRAADYGLWLQLAEDYGYLGIIHCTSIQYRRIGNNASSQIARLASASDSFKVISRFVLESRAPLKTNWMWLAHLERLLVQDYFRRLNNLLHISSFSKSLECLSLPTVSLGYYLISLASRSGLYNMFLFLSVRLYRNYLFSNTKLQRIFVYILSIRSW